MAHLARFGRRLVIAAFIALAVPTLFLHADAVPPPPRAHVYYAPFVANEWDAARTLPTPSPTATSSATATASPSAKPSAASSATATSSPSATASASATSSATVTSSPSATPSATATDTRTPTRTRTATPIPTATETATATPTHTATPTPTETATPSPTETPTLTPTPRPVVFAVIGDYGLAGSGVASVANLVKSWNPEFIITTGDNNYEYGAWSSIDQNIGQYFRSFIYPYVGGYGAGASINRFFPTLGNHDWYTSGAWPYLNYFALPGNERYYSFYWGPVQLFSLDSDPNEPDGVTSDSPQGVWLQNQLARSSACWKLVYFHHPPYSSGPNGSTAWMQWPFAEWGANAVLSGHDHTYERVMRNGFAYFVNGLGGKSSYGFGTPVQGSTVRYSGGFGAMRVTAEARKLRFEFIAVNGSVVDSYTQSGGCN